MVCFLLVFSMLCAAYRSLPHAKVNPNTPPRHAGTRRTQGRIDLSRMEVCLPSTGLTPHHVLPRAALPHLLNRYSRRTRRFNRVLVTVLVSHEQAASLRRYRKVHKLGDSPPGSSKEELLPAVARHFAAQASSYTFLAACAHDCISLQLTTPNQRA